MDRLIHKLVRQNGSNDPYIITAGLNIEVRITDLGSETKGLYVCKLRRRCIFINKQLNEVWRRFVLAHELGHDRLHKGFSRFFIEEKTLFVPGRYEREANQFAIKLLLYGSNSEEGETAETYCLRYGVPVEMTRYL